MDIPDQLQEVWLRLHDDRLVPVLEEMPPPPVAPIEGARVAGQEGAHGPRHRGRPGPHQAVEVIRHEGPGGEGEVRRPGHFPQSAADVLAVRGVPDNGAAFHPAHPAVGEGVGGIPARAAGHRGGTGA